MAKTPKTKPAFGPPPPGMEQYAASPEELAELKNSIPRIEFTDEQKREAEYKAFWHSVAYDEQLSEIILGLRSDVIDLKTRRVPFHATPSEQATLSFLEACRNVNTTTDSLNERVKLLLLPYSELSAIAERTFGIKAKPPLSGPGKTAKPMKFNVEEELTNEKVEEIKLRSSLTGLFNLLEQFAQEAQHQHANIALRLQNDVDEAKTTFTDLNEVMHDIHKDILAVEALNTKFRRVHTECMALLQQGHENTLRTAVAAAKEPGQKA